MSKRLTDSRKWDDPFFIDLSNDYKLLWLLILDKCDHSGIFKVSKRLMEFSLNIKIDFEDVKKVFKERINFINNEKWFVSKFIEFQYGTLSEKNRVHLSAINMLKKEGLYKTLTRPLQGYKDKDKVKDMDKVKDLFDNLWKKYPRKLGKDDAFRHFKVQVITGEDYENIEKALNNYNKSSNVVNKTEYIKHGSSWFNKHWKDWIDYKEQQKGKVSDGLKQI